MLRIGHRPLGPAPVTKRGSTIGPAVLRPDPRTTVHARGNIAPTRSAGPPAPRPPQRVAPQRSPHAGLPPPLASGLAPRRRAPRVRSVADNLCARPPAPQACLQGLHAARHQPAATGRRTAPPQRDRRVPAGSVLASVSNIEAA